MESISRSASLTTVIGSKGRIEQEKAEKACPLLLGQAFLLVLTGPFLIDFFEGYVNIKT